ncbi:hypothetical protein ID858_15460, partial [Xenorhabdus sp. DI]|nr:hypothetical protein [Xenorhabdus sp. 3]MBD2789897.1 hypothetical protein [Xenorhabdus sp. DI]
VKNLGLVETKELAKNAQPAGNYASAVSQTFTGEVRAPNIIIGAINNQSFFFQRDGVWTWTVQQNGAWRGEIKHPGRGGIFSLQGDSYTKGESDGRYQPRGNYQHAGNYQPAGNYAVRGESYTRGESDNRYLQRDTGTRRTQEKVVWTGWIQDRGTMNCTEDIAGCLVYIRIKNGQCLPLEVPVDRRVFSTQWPAGWWGRIEFFPPATLIWQDGGQVMDQVVLSK